MPTRRPNPSDRVPPEPPSSPSDFDEEIPEELAGRSAEELYGDAYPEEEPIAPSPEGRGLNPDATRIGVAAAAPVDDEEPRPDATLAGPPIKLEIQAGPDEGNVKRFRGVRMVVGRGKGCDLELTDPSVSRRHLELIHGEKGTLLRDLESTTGTIVNGEKVTERYLQHDDVIGLGKTRLRFVDEVVLFRKEREEAERRAAEEKLQAERAEAEAKAAEQAATPEKPPTVAELPLPEGPLAPVVGVWRKIGAGPKRALLLAIPLVVVLVLVLRFLMSSSGPPPPSADQILAQRRYALAQKAMSEQRYSDVVLLIQKAKETVPGIDVDGLLPEAQTDAAAASAIDRAKALLAQGHYTDARTALEGISKGTDEQMRAKRDLLARVDAKQTIAFTQRAQDEIAQGNFAMAKEVIALLPAALQKTLTAQLEDAEAHAQLTRVLGARKAKAEREAAAHAREVAHQRKIQAAFGSVSRKLESLEWDRAVLACDHPMRSHDPEIRAQAKRIKALIPKLQRTYEAGLRKSAAGTPELAVWPLRKAKHYYEEIGLPGPLGVKIDHLLAVSALAAARTALGRDDLQSAFDSFHEALRLEPTNAEAQKGLKSLIKQTSQLLLQAYVIRDRDPKGAIAKLQLVMRIAPEGSPNYEKAKSRLLLLQP